MRRKIVGLCALGCFEVVAIFVIGTCLECDYGCDCDEEYYQYLFHQQQYLQIIVQQNKRGSACLYFLKNQQDKIQRIISNIDILIKGIFISLKICRRKHKLYSSQVKTLHSSKMAIILQNKNPSIISSFLNQSLKKQKQAQSILYLSDKQSYVYKFNTCEHKYIFTINSAFILSLNMFAEKLVEQRLQHFRKQIRQQEIQTIVQKQRQNLLRNSYFNQLALKLSFPKNHPEADIVCKVLEQKKQTLLQPFKNEMLNQGQSQGQITTDMHVAFWQQCLFWLQQNKNSSQVVAPLLVNFIVQFKQSYTCRECAKNPTFLNLFIELIQKFVFQIQDLTRKAIAQWISDARYIQLVHKLFTSTQDFPVPQFYPNIYQTIEQALNSQIPVYQQSAASFFLQITKYANSTQNFLIYKHKVKIFYKLIQILESNCNSAEATYFWPPIFYSLNTYPQALKQYCSPRLLNVCKKLLKSRLQDNVFGALVIIKVLSRGQEQILQILKANIEYCEQNWLSVSLEQKLYNHSKIDISKVFLQIIKNLLFWSKENEVIFLCGLFEKKDKSIMALIKSIWQTSRKDEETVNTTLQCVSALLLLNDILMFDEQPIEIFLQSRNMLPFISKCELSENSEIRGNALCILDQIDAIGKKKDHEFI